MLMAPLSLKREGEGLGFPPSNESIVVSGSLEKKLGVGWVRVWFGHFRGLFFQVSTSLMTPNVSIDRMKSIRHIVTVEKVRLINPLEHVWEVEPHHMTRKDSLHEIISGLINRRTEGPYWDFKREHHSEKWRLIHDVLCLANAKHRGDRFLIFGVDNNDFSFHPITEDTGRKTQADVAALFRDNADKFFQSRFPIFYLEEIAIDGNPIDILVIEDSPHKPYYLVKKIKGVRAYHVYTRICDTNTPLNSAAPPHEIEGMWRERFGLDVPPLERAKLYLNEPEAWSLLVENISSNVAYYYTSFPEFTLRVASAEAIMACHEEGTRGELRTDNNHAGYYKLRYHQTLLHRIRYVSFDDHKKTMVAPKIEPRGTGRFYFYEADSIEYAVQQFIRHRDDSKTLSIRGRGQASDEARSRWGHNMKIPVLRAGEAEGFLGALVKDGFIEAITDEEEQYQIHLRNQLDFEDWRFS